MFDLGDLTSRLQSELTRLRADGQDRAVRELVDVVGACQSVINQATALQMLAMAHVAAIEDVDLEDGTVAEQHRGLGHQRLDAPDLVGEELGMTAGAASNRMAVAVDVASRLGGVLGAMGQGRLDGYRAAIVSEELHDASPQVCAEVLAAIDDSLGREPAASLRRRVRRELAAVDADLVRAKAVRARSERNLRRWPGDEPGVDTWMGSFPTEQSRSGWAVVDGLARQYVRDGVATGLEQARADALMDLIHARATGTFVVQLAVPADTVPYLAEPDGPGSATDGEDKHGTNANRGTANTAETAGTVEAANRAIAAGPEGDELVAVAGLGLPGTTHVRRAWVRTLIEATGPAGRREVVACHATTGALLAVASSLDQQDPVGRRRPRGPRTTGSTSYRPAAAVVDLVKARDGRCRFPGCTVNARFCDLDHVRPWPVGPTRATNLMCLCRRHHRIKQTTRWRVRIAPDATVTWTDPAGRVRTTLPTDFLQLGGPAQQRPAQPRPPALAAELASSQHLVPDAAGPAPVDGPGVLWTAWEEELAHGLSRATRRNSGRRADLIRTEEQVGGGRSMVDLVDRPEALTFGPGLLSGSCLSGSCRSRRPGRPTRRSARARWTVDGDPPF